MVAFKDKDGVFQALGFLQASRLILHGQTIPSNCDVVLVKHLLKSSVPAPVVIGDAEEKRLLAVGQFFALPRKQLCLVTIVNQLVSQQ